MKTYDIQFLLYQVRTGVMEEIAEAVCLYNAEAGPSNKHGYLIVSKSLLNHYQKELYEGMKGRVLEEAFGCRVISDRRCAQDVIYLMTTDSPGDLLGKLSAMFREIRKLEKKGIDMIR